MSLNVKGSGTVKLKAGDGTTFELKDCLWVPDLSRNLVAGGILKSKGVRELYDDNDPSNFALVRWNLALFNGFIGSDNLIHLQLEQVSRQPLLCVSTVTDSDLAHRCLGHVSRQYLNKMCRSGSVFECSSQDVSSKSCDIFSLSKGTALPYNHSRPRAANRLENVHVDLSEIIRTKGMNNESYYILFTDDHSSFRHIFPLSDKTKEEVHEGFVTYIALVTMTV